MDSNHPNPETWPPPILRETTPPVAELSKDEKKAIKNRWYYTTMLLGFIVSVAPVFTKHQALSINTDNAIGWIGIPFFYGKRLDLG